MFGNFYLLILKNLLSFRQRKGGGERERERNRRREVERFFLSKTFPLCPLFTTACPNKARLLRKAH